MPDRLHEPAIYKELVADLANSIVPTGIMGLTILGIGSYAQAQTGTIAASAATIVGGLASAFKIELLRRHRHFNAAGSRSLEATRSFETAHAVGTMGVAASVASLTALMFLRPDPPLHIVATALLFGYCSGVACRLAVRPALARGTLAVAAVPGILAAASVPDVAHWIVAAVFAVFLAGAMETVTHVHGTARRHIALRLAMTDLARRDPLTGLRNRLALTEGFDRLRSLGGGMVAVHAFDLDGFKGVNDDYGHAVGDGLLQAIAERLRDIVGEDDVAIRMGGDEFVVLQAGALTQGEVEAYAERIHRHLTTPYGIQEHRLQIGVSLGSGMARGAEADLGQLLATADALSYRAKRQGRSEVASREPRPGDRRPTERAIRHQRDLSDS